MDAGDVPALVRAYEDGLYTFPELAAMLLRWSQEFPLEQLAAELSVPLQQQFATLLRDLYENDRPADAYVSFGGEPMTDEVLAAVKVWLAGQGLTASDKK